MDAVAWSDISPSLQGTMLSDLLYRHNNVQVAPDLVDAFDSLLMLLSAPHAFEKQELEQHHQQHQNFIRRYLHSNNTDMLDKVMVMACQFDLHNVADEIAEALIKQEEDRAAKSQCLRCGRNHPNFHLVTCELCDICRSMSCAASNNGYDVNKSPPHLLQQYKLHSTSSEGLASSAPITLQHVQGYAQGLGDTIQL